MKYYRVLDDLSYSNRWFLGEVNFPDEWEFWDYVTVGKLPSINKELAVEVSEKGTPLNLTMGEFEVLIADKSVAELFLDEEILKIPITIIGRESESYFILVIKKELDCIDREKSIFTLWEEGNDIRPDLAGEYESIPKMIIDVDRTKGLDIFRIKGFNVAVIVSERIKHAFEESGLTGVKFKEV